MSIRSLINTPFPPGTVSCVQMGRCSTKPTSFATGGSTLTAQRSDYHVDYYERPDIFVMMMILYSEYYRHKQHITEYLTFMYFNFWDLF